MSHICCQGTRHLLSILHTLWQRELHLPLVVQTRHSPRAVGIHTVFIDLEPLQSCHGGCQGAVNFGQVHHDGTQVAGVNGVGLVGRRGGVERMVPFCSKFVAGFDVDDVFGEGLVKWVWAGKCKLLRSKSKVLESAGFGKYKALPTLRCISYHWK